jgi:hypothetical protein
MRQVGPRIPFVLLAVGVLLAFSPFRGLGVAGHYPQGDYKNSCRDLVIVGWMLEAQCQRRDGSWNATSFYLRACDGPLSNQDGELVCPGEMPPERILPESFRETCREISLRRGTLEARCLRIDGTWNWSTLALGSCYGEIANDNGVLRCGGRQVYAPIPKGSYTQSCRDLEVQGSVLTGECRDSRDRWVPASLDLRACRGEVGNSNGVLVCP